MTVVVTLVSLLALLGSSVAELTVAASIRALRQNYGGVGTARTNGEIFDTKALLLPT
jgi:hypothetical protein